MKAATDMHSKMLFIALFSILTILLSTQPICAQDTYKTVTIKVNNKDLKSVLVTLAKQTDYKMVISSSIDLGQQVSLNYKNIPLARFLNEFLPSLGISYTIDAEHIRLVTDKEKNEGSYSKADTIQAIPLVAKVGKSFYRVTGTVKDSDGETVPGAVVQVKSNKSTGTTTDIDGAYTIAVPSLNDELIVSLLGMKTQTIPIKGKSTIDVTLELDVAELEEFIITGYGAKAKNTFTGTAVQVKGDELRTISPVNVFDALKAFDPSFSVLDIEGVFGSDPNHVPDNIQIRGQGSMPDISEGNLQTYTSLPIFILDGFQVNVQEIYDLDMNRIQTVTILKDAAASSIYGSRAANGVIVIETKVPQGGKLQFFYTMNASMQVPDLSSYNLMNANESLEYLRRAQVFNNGTSGTSIASNDYEESIGGNPIRQNLYYLLLNDVKHGTDSYWLSQPVHTAFQHSHSLLMEGGSVFNNDKRQNIRYQVSLNAALTDGVMKGSQRDKYGVGMKLLYNNKNVQITNDVKTSMTDSQESPFGSYSTYANMFPFYRMTDEKGNYYPVLSYTNIPTYSNFPDAGISTGMIADQQNPLYEAANLTNRNKARAVMMTYNLGINWEIISDLRLKGTFSLAYMQNNSDVYKSSFSPTYVDYSSGSNVGLEEIYKRGSYRKSETNSTDYTGNIQLSYLKSFGIHTVQGILGGEFTENNYQSDSYTAVGFIDDALSYPSYGTQFEPDGRPSGSYSLVRSIGSFANFNYSFDNRYLVDFSTRIDASSNFASKKRTAPFWSGGLRWNAYNEQFIKKLGLVDNLSFRATIGTTGNQNFKLSEVMYLYKYTQMYDGVMGAELISLANENLKWQTTLKKNLGMEFSILKNLVSFDFNVYQEMTNDNITDIKTLPSTGFSTYKANLGKIENKGVEFSLNVTPIRTKDLRLSLFLNGLHNKNKIVSISDALKDYNKKIMASQTAGMGVASVTALEKAFLFEEGGSLRDIYAVRSLGIDPANGKEIYLTKGGKKAYVWNAADQVIVGNTEPTLKGFFRLNMDYKNWNLSSAFEYSIGSDLYNNTLYQKVEGGNFSVNTDRRALEGRWSQPGDVAQFKAYTDRGRLFPTSRFVQKNDYMSMSSLRLMYTFDPKVLLSGISMLKLSASTNDLFYLSTIRQERGTSYPFARTFYFTVQASF